MSNEILIEIIFSFFFHITSNKSGSAFIIFSWNLIILHPRILYLEFWKIIHLDGWR